MPDVGASFLKAVVDSLEDNVRKALDSTGYDKLVLAGGVSANSVLRERMLSLAKEKKRRNLFSRAFTVWRQRGNGRGTRVF